MERLGLPFLIPVGSIVGAFLLIFTISQILLFVPREIAVPLAMLIATLILIGSAVVASTGGSSGNAVGSQRRRR